MQAAHYYFSGARLFANGPWDEDLLWLFGPSALAAPVSERGSERDFAATNGGYYKLRTESGFAFVRCATFRDRPGQADLLHVDLWWRGRNIACDAGTFSYNSPDPWNNPLAHTAYHNTVTVDDRDQMDRIARFLWLPWLKGKVHGCKRTSAGHLAYWEGSHDGYARLTPPVDHRRGVLQLGDESWLVVDSLTSSAPHRYRLQWLVPDMDHSWQEEQAMLTLETEAGPYHVQTVALPRRGVCSLVRGDENSARGWRAPYYSYKEPALSLDLTVEDTNVLFLTCFSPESFSLAWKGDSISVKADSWQGDLSMRAAGTEANLISCVSLRGIREDRLDLI
jgi:asparagine synthase (glutamine-hydrolysing)